MRARLFAKTGLLCGAEYVIDGKATIGRDSSNTIVLGQNIVSGRHARITFDGDLDCFVLEDLGSSNGTKVDGVRVKRPERLGRLHVITFAGRLDFIFQRLEGGAIPADADRTAADGASVPFPDLADDAVERTVVGHEASPIPANLAGGGEPPPPPPAAVERVLQVEPSSESPRSIALKEGENVVGRGEDADARIDDRSVSRKHASITIRGGAAYVKDLGSANGTFMNGKPVEAETEVPPGTDITFGTMKTRYLERKGQDPS